MSSSRVPTPHGQIETTFERNEAGWTLDVTVPPGTTCRLELAPTENLVADTIVVESRSLSHDIEAEQPRTQ